MGSNSILEERLNDIFLAQNRRQHRCYSHMQTPRGVKLDGHKAMLFNFGVTFPVDAVTRSLEMG